MVRKAPKPKKKATTAKFSKKKLPKGAVKRVKVRKGAKPVKKFRPAYKSVALPEQTIEAALTDAFAEIDALKDEMVDIVDNMSGMEHLPKYEVADTAQNELGEHSDCPDVPELLKNKTITGLTEMVSTRKGRGTSRSMRLSNATSIIAYVREHIITEPSYTNEEREAANDLADELEEHENIEVEFPGMYG